MEGKYRDFPWFLNLQKSILNMHAFDHLTVTLQATANMHQGGHKENVLLKS